MDHNLEEDKEKCEIEEQFLLRLPEKEAKKVHKILKKKLKKVKDMITLDLDVDSREATITIRKKELKGHLVDLPTVNESYKTTDNVNLFKTANISQMLICSKAKDVNDDNKIDKYPHGITPPLKNVRKCRFRKTLKNPNNPAEFEDIEKEVLLLLRADNEAISTRFKICYENEPINTSASTINEVTLFGDTLSSSSSDSDSGASGLNDIMDFTT